MVNSVTVWNILPYIFKCVTIIIITYKADARLNISLFFAHIFIIEYLYSSIYIKILSLDT